MTNGKTKSKTIGLFQSAPLTDVRGDIRVDLTGLNIKKVSIRSPHGCKGRFEVAVLFLTYSIVSIRSPHGCKGRCPRPFLDWMRSLFQSAPLTDVRGDLTRPFRGCGSAFVSIRSPHGCKGRSDYRGRRAALWQGFNPLPSRM